MVVGDGQALAQVHVHLADPGAAVEAALGLGELSQIRITALDAPPAGARTVVALVAGPGLARAARDAGAVPVDVADAPALDELADLLRGLEGDLLVLPGSPETLAAARALLQRLRADHRAARPGRRWAVLPTVAPVPVLAALAVHEPQADFDSALAAMSAAAGHVRHGSVRLVDGRVTALVDAEVVATGDEPAAVAGRLADRLLASGGELLTAVLGADAPAGLAAELGRQLAEGHPDLEVQVLDGGQAGELVLLGAE